MNYNPYKPKPSIDPYEQFSPKSYRNPTDPNDKEAQGVADEAADHDIDRLLRGCSDERGYQERLLKRLFKRLYPDDAR